MKLLASIIILFVLVLPAWGQGSPNSVAQSIATKSVAPNGVVNILPQNNIGQNSHQLLIYTTNVASNTCGPGAFIGPASIEGSIDNVVYKQISTNAGQGPIVPPSPIATDTDPLVSYAIGVFPYLRVKWTNNIPGTCALTIWYTASVSPNAYSGSPRTIDDQYTFLAIANLDPGTTTIGGLCPGMTAFGGGTFVLYALYLYNPTASNTITINAPAVSSWYTYTVLANLPVAFQFLGMPNTGKPYYVAYASQLAYQGIQLMTIDAGVSGFMNYRCE